jgi:hypothetical protein
LTALVIRSNRSHSAKKLVDALAGTRIGERGSLEAFGRAQLAVRRRVDQAPVRNRVPEEIGETVGDVVVAELSSGAAFSMEQELRRLSIASTTTRAPSRKVPLPLPRVVLPACAANSAGC